MVVEMGGLPTVVVMYDHVLRTLELILFLSGGEIIVSIQCLSNHSNCGLGGCLR